MSSPSVLLERLVPEPTPGLRGEQGRDWLTTHGLPDRHAEAWRYTPVDDITAALELAHPAPDQWSITDRSDIDRWAGNHGGPRLVFVNGRFAAALSDTDKATAGLWIGDADGMRQLQIPEENVGGDQPTDGFQALNWAAGGDVAAVVTEPGVAPDHPVHVVHLSAPGERLAISHPRTVIRLGAASRLHVIESFVGLEGRFITNAYASIVAGAGSSLTYHRLATEPLDTIHVGRVAIDQEAGSSVQVGPIVTGGEIVRTAIDVKLGGDGATLDLDGLYVAGDHQRHDTVVTVDHTGSHARSTQRIKGIVDEHGRGSFSGHVIVREGTVGTDARQSNPNLVLAPTAQADTRPWLEIFADDVQCTHGATVGRLDHDALFYLRSRGIPAEHARSMLVVAFAAEVIDTITPESLRHQLTDWLHTRMVEVPS